VCRAVGIRIADVVVIPGQRRSRGPGPIDISRNDVGVASRPRRAVAESPSA